MQSIKQSKASNLAVIQSLNSPCFYTSPFIVIDARTVDDLRKGRLDRAGLAKKLQPDLQRLFARAKRCRLEQAYAIRSSACNEDSEQASFAGQYETRLAVAPDDLIDQIHAMAIARDASRLANLAAYTSNLLAMPDKDSDSLALIVQAMVPADTAGVAFSRDPVGSSDAMLVSSTRGLGDKLMAGTQDGQHTWLESDGRIVRDTQSLQTSPILSDRQLRQIQRAIKTLQQNLSMPDIDIEWAFAGHRLYILQARPITTPARNQSSPEVTIYEGSNIQESYPGVTTPMTFSFIKRAYAGVYRSFCNLMGVRLKAHHDPIFADLLAQRDGAVYYNLNNWYRLIGLLPAYRSTRPKMEKMMGIESPDRSLIDVDALASKARPLDAVRCLATITFNFFTLQANCSAFDRRCQLALEQVETLASQPDKNIDRAIELYQYLEAKLIDDFKAPVANDFFAMLAFGLLSDRCAGKDKGTLYDALLPHGKVASTRPPALLADIKSAIQAQGRDLCELFIDGDTNDIERLEIIGSIPAAKISYDTFIRDFGDRAIGELKLETITYRQDPSLLMRIIVQVLQQDDMRKPKGQNKDGDENRSISFDDPLTSWLARLTAQLLANRENLRLRRSQVFGMVRSLLLMIGEQMVIRGDLDDPRDVFYLDIDYLIAHARLPRDNALEAPDARERASIARALHLEQTEAAVNRPPARRLIMVQDKKSNRLVPLDLGVDKSQSTLSSCTINGLGASRGLVRGRACVITDPATQTMDGYDILVANTTDPGWIVHFASCKGIVVDHGSLLSHTAIVARELGIPAVVSAQTATSHINTGDMIQIDGTTGKVIKWTQI